MPVAYSPYSTLYISHGTAEENLSNNPELCKLWIISVILMSLILWEKLDAYHFKGWKGEAHFISPICPLHP